VKFLSLLYESEIHFAKFRQKRQRPPVLQNPPANRFAVYGGDIDLPLGLSPHSRKTEPSRPANLTFKEGAYDRIVQLPQFSQEQLAALDKRR